MTRHYICTSCPRGCKLTVVGETEVVSVAGNRCPKGESFARSEWTDPKRILTTTVRTAFAEVPVVSVRTTSAIALKRFPELIRQLKRYVLRERLGCGERLPGLEDDIEIVVTTDELREDLPWKI